MHRFKMIGLGAIATAALLWIPSGPAAAGGPLLFAPWALGHLLRAATLPLVVAAEAVSGAASYGYDEPQYPGRPGYYSPGYGAPPAYYGAPAYSASGYYAPPVRYYAPGPAYYPAPPVFYGYPRPFMRYYGSRGYDAAPRLRYSGPHGSQGWHGGGGHYRRW